MKKQILTLIIGILIGAIITTGVFLVLKGNKKDGNNGENIPAMDGKFPGRDGNFPGKDGNFPSDDGNFPGKDGNFPSGERPNRNNKSNEPKATNSDDVSSNSVEE